MLPWLKKNDEKPLLKAVIIFVILYGISVALSQVWRTVIDRSSVSISQRITLLIGSLLGIRMILSSKLKITGIHAPNRVDVLIASSVLGLFVLNNLYAKQVDPSFGEALTTSVIIRFAIGSITEEFLYRGLLQPYIDQHSTSHRVLTTGNLVATGLMAVAHIGFFYVMTPKMAFTSFGLVVVFSLAAGVLRSRSGGLILPILFHLFANAIHLTIHAI